MHTLTTSLNEQNAQSLWHDWVALYHPHLAAIPIYYQGITDSTNSMAMQALASGANKAINIAGQQTQGQGQRGNPWLSPTGNIYLSILWPCKQPLSGQLSLELALKVATLPYLQTPAPLAVKWPNDLVDSSGRKVGGILVLPKGDHLIVGIGLNTATAPALETDKYQSASLASMYPLPPYTSMVFDLCAAIIDILERQAFEPDLPARFLPYDYLLYKRCTFKQNQQLSRGICQGVQADGALHVLTPYGLQVCYTGPITVDNT